MEDKEAIYDEQIAPLMTQLLEICQREGVPMFASFQYNEDGFCTSAQSSGHCVFDHYRALAQCAEHGGVNVDKYMDWVAKDARKNGHSSIYLKMSGIPEVPPNAQVNRRRSTKCGGHQHRPSKCRRHGLCWRPR